MTDDMADHLATHDAGGGPHPLVISVLGPLEVRRAGSPITLPGRVARRILVHLVLDIGRPVAADVIVDRVWGPAPPSSARKSVQKAVWALRRALGSDVDGVISTGDLGYTLTIDPGAVDAHRFEQLLDAAFDAPTPEAIDLLDAAERLWRGPALDGCSDFEEVMPAATRLDELRVTANERRLGLLIESGRHIEALTELERLARRHPLREELWAHLMTARALAGRRDDALAALQEIRHQLAEELGIEPSSRLRDLEQRVLAGTLTPTDAPTTAVTAPDAASVLGAAPQRSASPLPQWLTSFVGRTSLLAELERRLDAARLVTLTGVGGSGKTRVAVELARRRRGTDLPVHFVDLSGIEHPELVAPATAEALGVADRTGSDLAPSLAEMLGGRRALVIFDNCEHLRDCTASLVDGLLHASPDLTVLATSREPLGLHGEHVTPVPPLELPDRDSSDDPASTESVALFMERARAADAGFTFDDDTAPAVIEICSRLDGIPLALELAAAQLPTVTVRDMATHLGDRLDVLTSSTARPARHTTLRAAIDWSVELLGQTETDAFAGLSVFPASFDLAAAAAVIGDGAEIDVVPLLGGLVRRSMVVRAPDHAGSARYRLLHMPRAAGRDLLTSRELDGERLRHAHARHYTSLAERYADPGPNDGEDWDEVLATEYPNLLGAIEHGVQAAPDLAVRLVDALACFWTRRPDRVADGLRCVTPLLDRTDLDLDQLARVRCCAAELLSESGESERARHEAERALARFEQRDDTDHANRAVLAVARALVNGGDLDAGAQVLESCQERFAPRRGERWAVTTMTLGFARRAQGDYDRAAHAFAQMLLWARRHGLASSEAKAEWLLGSVAHHRGTAGAATRHCERALRLYGDVGDRTGVAHVQMTLGDVRRLDGDDDGARKLYEEAHRTMKEIGDPRCTASAVKNLADLECERDRARAAELYLDCLERRSALGDRSGLAEAFEGLAAVAATAGRADDAASLLGRADALRAETGAVVLEVDRARVDAAQRRIAATMPPEQAAAALDAARALGPDEALARAHAVAETLAATG